MGKGGGGGGRHGGGGGAVGKAQKELAAFESAFPGRGAGMGGLLSVAKDYDSGKASPKDLASAFTRADGGVTAFERASPRAGGEAYYNQALGLARSVRTALALHPNLDTSRSLANRIITTPANNNPGYARLVAGIRR